MTIDTAGLGELIDNFAEAVREAEFDCHFRPPATWQRQCDERERARLALDTAAAALLDRVQVLEKAGRYIMPYLVWTIGPESPGHHPTMPSAVEEFKAALQKDDGSVCVPNLPHRSPPDD